MLIDCSCNGVDESVSVLMEEERGKNQPAIISQTLAACTVAKF
jgi:hypothetical protein